MHRAGAISIAGFAAAIPLALVAFTLYDGSAEPPRETTMPAASVTPTSPTPSPTPRSATATPDSPPPSSAAPVRSRPCSEPATKAFSPTTISIPGVTTGARVLAIGMDARGVPGTPPISDEGKTEFAWVPDIAPGMSAGNVLLNAHTWPDGTALGNHLLAGLQQGGRLVVHGRGGAELCYRVTERREVDAAASVPDYFALDGPPQLAIVVCSGTRLGPGNWTHRTLWFASPEA